MVKTKNHWNIYMTIYLIIAISLMAFGLIVLLKIIVFESLLLRVGGITSLLAGAMLMTIVALKSK